MRKSVPRRDFHLPLADANGSQIILVIITLVSWDAPLLFNLVTRDRSFSFLLLTIFFVRVQCLRVAQRVTIFCTVPPYETYGTHVKVARIITRFPERRGGGIFLSHLEAASFLRRVRDERGRQSATAVCNILRDIDLGGRVH